MTGDRPAEQSAAPGRLAGRTVLVTGGGSGIGRGVVDAYIAEGAHVTVLERSAEYIAKLAGDVGDAVTIVHGDATDPDALEEAVTTAARNGSTGTDRSRPADAAPTTSAADDAPRLDQLTCCAGVFDYYASVRELTAADLRSAAEEIWCVNVLSGLLAVNIAYPCLRAARGSVTLTLSASAFYPEGGGVLYGSSKWALRGVVAHLAKDLAPDVRVNGVAPGGTSGTRLGGLDALDQEMTADRVDGRDQRIKAGNALDVIPRPEDHAGAYVYLADPVAARVVTGVVVNTDGGRT